MRVLLVDDHPTVRRAYARVLQDEPDMEVVGEAANGMEAIHLTRHLRPDVVVMDVGMPGMDGIQATRMIHVMLPTVGVIGLSESAEAEQGAAMREAGAVAYVTKSAPSRSCSGLCGGCTGRVCEQLSPEAAA